MLIINEDHLLLSSPPAISSLWEPLAFSSIWTSILWKITSHLEMIEYLTRSWRVLLKIVCYKSLHIMFSFFFCTFFTISYGISMVVRSIIWPSSVIVNEWVIAVGKDTCEYRKRSDCEHLERLDTCTRLRWSHLFWHFGEFGYSSDLIMSWLSCNE